MPISIFTGKPGSGKSLKTADVILQLLHRNLKWHERQMLVWQKLPEGMEKNKYKPVLRQVFSNLRLNRKIELAYPGQILYWKDPEELIRVRDADVIIDEIATYMDSTQWKELPLAFKRWLQQHRKLGIEIYGNTQDFAMVDIAMRRLTSDLYILYKLIGSRDPSPTSPPVKRVWGIILMKSVAPETYQMEKLEMKAEGLSLFFIRKELVSAYDTRQEIVAGESAPLKHQKRRCPDCGLIKISHA